MKLNQYTKEKDMIPEKHHHIVYGTLKDCLTGEELMDTDDERTRQALASMMLNDLHYSADQLRTRATIETLFSTIFVRSTIELVVSVDNKEFMILRYGPGSLVSRERSAIAAARVLNPEYRIPLAVVTNGKDAELLDTITGNILGSGLDSIPDAQKAKKLVTELTYLPPLQDVRHERELRILNTFDIDRCCL